MGGWIDTLVFLPTLLAGQPPAVSSSVLVEVDGAQTWAWDVPVGVSHALSVQQSAVSVPGVLLCLPLLY